MAAFMLSQIFMLQIYFALFENLDIPRQKVCFLVFSCVLRSAASKSANNTITPLQHFHALKTKKNTPAFLNVGVPHNNDSITFMTKTTFAVASLPAWLFVRGPSRVSPTGGAACIAYPPLCGILLSDTLNHMPCAHPLS